MVAAQICFNTSTFILFFMLNIAIIVWALFSSYQQGIENREQSCMHDKNQTLSQIEQIIDNRLQQSLESTQPPPPEEFLPPPPPLWVPTRGIPSDFYVIGYVYRQNKPKHTMKLLERYLYSGRYEYCVLHHENPTIKIPVYTHNYEQLSDADKVKIQGYKGEFTCAIFR